MVILPGYNEFAGRHPETGTIRNALAYQGVKTPHTDAPISEALLLGVSGGITVGYFTFEYEGYPPHIVLLTRNTFDPMTTVFERLAIPQDVVHTSSANKGAANLQAALEAGNPAIVWADRFLMPYNHLPYDENNWAMMPLLVYGEEGGQAYLADRANCPIVVPSDVLQQARARIKKDKFRVMTLDAPDMERLTSAVSKGIWQCIGLYTDGPPKGKRENFGLAALQHWAKLLTNTRNKQSWARYFPAGERLWMALAGNVTQPGLFGWLDCGEGNAAERGMYADFLAEAAAILSKPTLNEAAAFFRRSEAEWATLAEGLLPQSASIFAETRDLLAQKRRLFVEHGTEADDEVRKINERLTAIQHAVTTEFPMDDDEVTAFREGLAEQVLKIREIEEAAVACMQSAMV